MSVAPANADAGSGTPFSGSQKPSARASGVSPGAGGGSRSTAADDAAGICGYRAANHPSKVRGVVVIVVSSRAPPIILREPDEPARTAMNAVYTPEKSPHQEAHPCPAKPAAPSFVAVHGA